MDLTDKIVVVTAASKGIGAATAVAFAAKGAQVVINYRTDDVAAESVQRQIASSGGRATICKADVFTDEGVESLFAFVQKNYGSIDVLVNNAGLPAEPEFGQYTFGSINQSLTQNIGSAVMCSQVAVPMMNAGGSILFTTSIYGLQFGGNPGLLLYSAGKAAMINFAQTLAEDLSPNIRCNVVAPGTTKTPAWDGSSPEYAAKSLDMTLQKEWVEASEIADAFVFLAVTPHINAQTIVIDGGWQKKIRDK